MDPDDIKDAPRVHIKEISELENTTMPFKSTMPMPIPLSSAAPTFHPSRKPQQYPSSLPSSRTAVTLKHHNSSIHETDPGHNEVSNRNFPKTNSVGDDNHQRSSR